MEKKKRHPKEIFHLKLCFFLKMRLEARSFEIQWHNRSQAESTVKLENISLRGNENIKKGYNKKKRRRKTSGIENEALKFMNGKKTHAHTQN